MAGVTINRDAGDKSKGFRLQKLRAIDLLLDAIQQSDCAQIFAVIEHEEDIKIEKSTLDKKEEYLEQNKNYDPESTFTFASPEVKNTLVNFLDCWINRDMSNDVFFGFYTNIGLGKENQTSKLTDADITLPAKPILELLRDYNYSEPNLLDTVKFIILEEYNKQYSNKNIKAKGHYKVIETFSDEVWKDFLGKIVWKFGQEDEEKLKSTLIQKIRKSKYFDIKLDGKENHIIALAEQMFDERQKFSEITKKVVHASELKLIFMEVKSGEYKLDDPSYKMWDMLPPVTDKRNLEKKYQQSAQDIVEEKLVLYLVRLYIVE